jgi:formamidopyrimidine-DNA glycosylase
VPELPEVQTIINDLNKHLAGAKIVDIKIGNNYSARPDNQTFINALKGKKIRTVSRIAKNILLEIEQNGIMHIHLAMTGRILLTDKESPDNWTRVSFKLEIEGVHKYLKFTDVRKFGKIGFFSDITASGLLEKYGPDLVSAPPTLDMFAKAIRKRNSSIKTVLLDQKVVAGLGNIYATDALFIAGIDPTRNSKTLTDEELEKLLDAAKTVLKEGIEHRGSTMPDKMYVDVFGKSGKYQDHFKMYLKTICPSCGENVINKKINGRGSYYCPKCQK